MWTEREKKKVELCDFHLIYSEFHINILSLVSTRSTHILSSFFFFFIYAHFLANREYFFTTFISRRHICRCLMTFFHPSPPKCIDFLRQKILGNDWVISCSLHSRWARNAFNLTRSVSYIFHQFSKALAVENILSCQSSQAVESNSERNNKNEHRHIQKKEKKKDTKKFFFFRQRLMRVRRVEDECWVVKMWKFRTTETRSLLAAGGRRRKISFSRFLGLERSFKPKSFR